VKLELMGGLSILESCRNPEKQAIHTEAPTTRLTEFTGAEASETHQDAYGGNFRRITSYICAGIKMVKKYKKTDDVFYFEHVT
jgi:hypothetical protein